MPSTNENHNIFFAASPLHLICINEFRRARNINKYKLILFLHKGNSHALQQIFLTLKELDFKQYKIFWIPKNKLLKYISEMFLIIELKLQSRNRNLLFLIIDFRNIFMQSLRRFFMNAEFILIDDGFYTFVAHEYFMSNNVFLPIPKSNNVSWFISKKIYFGNSFLYLKNKPLKIFTIYADEFINKMAEMNNLNYLRKLVSKKIKIEYDKVFFIGTQMAERGTLTLDQELLLVKTAKNYWEAKGKIMYYIGKRSTSKNKLELFKKNNIKVKSYNLPLELILVKKKSIPGNICTLGSTLQKSLRLIFDNKINFYFIDIKEFFKEDKEASIQMDEVDYFAAKYSYNSSNIKTIYLN